MTVSQDMSQAGQPTYERTETLARVPSAEKNLGAVVLYTIAASGGQRTHRILRKAVTLGRDEACDLALDDPKASRTHVRITPLPAGVHILDLDSRNGTFVDGTRVARTSTDGPCVLRVGNTVLRIARLSEAPEPDAEPSPLVGGAMYGSIRRQIALVGPTPLAVLVTGETGTGKEIVARMLHDASGRPGPFIAVNCAALPENLVESELFGHARGAFTGATQARPGVFASADGGTLLLDEVGDIPESAQAKLLRVLEDGVIRPVGSDGERRVDVRIVSATNRPLEADVGVRRDLLARLAPVRIAMPALREHPEDIPALAAHLARRAKHEPLEIEPDALEALALYDWPMNVRELDSVVRTATVAGETTLRIADLPGSIRACVGKRRPEPRDLSGEQERARIEQALHAHGGNVRRAAHALGLARSQMYRMLERLCLDPNAYRTNGARHEDCL